LTLHRGGGGGGPPPGLLGAKLPKVAHDAHIAEFDRSQLFFLPEAITTKMVARKQITTPMSGEPGRG